MLSFQKCRSSVEKQYDVKRFYLSHSEERLQVAPCLQNAEVRHPERTRATRFIKWKKKGLRELNDQSRCASSPIADGANTILSTLMSQYLKHITKIEKINAFSRAMEWITSAWLIDFQG